MRLKRREIELYEDVDSEATLDEMTDDVTEGVSKRVADIELVTDALLANKVDVEAAAVEAEIEDWLDAGPDGDDDEDTTTTATEDEEG